MKLIQGLIATPLDGGDDSFLVRASVHVVNDLRPGKGNVGEGQVDHVAMSADWNAWLTDEVYTAGACPAWWTFVTPGSKVSCQALKSPPTRQLRSVSELGHIVDDLWAGWLSTYIEDFVVVDAVLGVDWGTREKYIIKEISKITYGQRKVIITLIMNTKLC